MAKKTTYRTVSVDVPLAEPPARQTAVNINDNINVDLHLDYRQSAALRHLFVGLQQSMKYQLFRPSLGLIWVLEQIAAQIPELNENV